MGEDISRHPPRESLYLNPAAIRRIARGSENTTESLTLAAILAAQSDMGRSLRAYRHYYRSPYEDDENEEEEEEGEDESLEDDDENQTQDDHLRQFGRGNQDRRDDEDDDFLPSLNGRRTENEYSSRQPGRRQYQSRERRSGMQSNIQYCCLDHANQASTPDCSDCTFLPPETNMRELYQEPEPEPIAAVEPRLVSIDWKRRNCLVRALVYDLWDQKHKFYTYRCNILAKMLPNFYQLWLLPLLLANCTIKKKLKKINPNVPKIFDWIVNVAQL